MISQEWVDKDLVPSHFSHALFVDGFNWDDIHMLLRLIKKHWKGNKEVYISLKLEAQDKVFPRLFLTIGCVSN